MSRIRVRALDRSTAIGEAARRMAEDGERLAREICVRIDAAIDEFDHTAALTPHTVASTRSSVRAFAELLRRDDASGEIGLPPEAAIMVRLYVQRGVPLRVVLRAYNVGNGELWRVWRSAVRELDLAPELEVEVLDHATSVLLRFADGLTDAASRLYAEEEKAWRRSVAAIRKDMIGSLLANQPLDIDEAERVLVHDLRCWQIAAVLWSAEYGPQTDALEAAWRSLTAHVSATTAVSVMAGTRVLWGWWSKTDDADATASAAASWQAPSGVEVALGGPARGARGFRLSHQQALHARRIRELGHERLADVVAFGDVAVPALLTADAGVAEAFALDQLGPLAHDDTLSGRLRETLEAYLAAAQSPKATAQALGVHVNTVLYRLQQATELLGHPLDEDPLALQAALLILRYRH